MHIIACYIHQITRSPISDDVAVESSSTSSNNQAFKLQVIFPDIHKQDNPPLCLICLLDPCNPKPSWHSRAEHEELNRLKLQDQDSHRKHFITTRRLSALVGDSNHNDRRLQMARRGGMLVRSFERTYRSRQMARRGGMLVRELHQNILNSTRMPQTERLHTCDNKSDHAVEEL